MLTPDGQLATAGVEAATVVVVSTVVVSMGVVVSMREVSVVAVSAGEAFVVAVSTEAFLAALVISVQCEAATRSAAAELV